LGNSRDHSYLFYLILAVFLGIWSAVGIYQTGKLTFPIIAITSFVLTVLVSLGLLLVWRLGFKHSIFDFLATYLVVFIATPVIWLVLSTLLLYVYAYTVQICCKDNWFLNVDLWESLADIRFGDVFHAMWYGLTIFASITMSQRKNSSSILKWSATLIGLVATIGMTVTAYTAFLNI